MIRNIVFDISNVLAPFRFKEFLAEKGFDGTMIKRIIKASAMTPYWTEFEKGKGKPYRYRRGLWVWVSPRPA